MRIAIAKPDWGITGGFELVLARIVDHLSQDGHEVRYLAPAVPDSPCAPYGQDVPPDIWGRQPEYFRYLAMVDLFSGLYAGQADVLMSTQPPSFATPHPRHLGLFYHHIRAYYDLSSLMVEAGLAGDAEFHATAVELVRAIDDQLLRGVGWILAGSEDVRERLARYSGRTSRVGLFHAALVQDLDDDASVPPPGGHVLCVSRHEFPKRTELFVHAMTYLPHLNGLSVGAGGRLGYVQQLDEELTRDPDGARHAASRPMWCCNPEFVQPREARNPGSNLVFAGAVSPVRLSEAYRDALCVIAPAYGEDYGLTAIEAMAAGRPVIACKDGGGLLDLVEDGVTGLVVEPGGRAIAEAVSQLRDDPSMAATMGAAGRDVATAFTWERAMAEIYAGLDMVTS